MNILELITKLFSFSNNDNQKLNIYDILSLLGDGDSISSILSLIEKIRQGEIKLSDVLMQLLPTILPLIIDNKNTQGEQNSPCEENILQIECIENITSSEIYSKITNYFDDTAS